jgi:hypothetical protein
MESIAENARFVPIIAPKYSHRVTVLGARGVASVAGRHLLASFELKGNASYGTACEVAFTMKADPLVTSLASPIYQKIPTCFVAFSRGRRISIPLIFHTEGWEFGQILYPIQLSQMGSSWGYRSHAAISGRQSIRFRLLEEERVESQVLNEFHQLTGFVGVPAHMGRRRRPPEYNK